VKQAPFRVLMGAAMPAVLVEFGFLSNPDEEGRLADATYRGQLADALVAAIARFKAELEGHASALAPPPEPMPAPQPLPEDLR
jgi:N-acetylmuramoyl-L-alanine amidase